MSFTKNVRLEGDDDDNIIPGTEGIEQIFGFAGDDLITATDGDEIFGGAGFDTVEIAGNFADFSIFDFGSFDEPNAVEVFNDESGEGFFLESIELLRFDDQDVPVLGFIDDIGETRDGAAEIKMFPISSPIFEKPKLQISETPSKLPLEKILIEEVPEERAVGKYFKVSMDTIDDIDGFTVFLEAGKTYEIGADLLDSFEDPFDDDSSESGLELSGVFDPNDVLITGTDTGENTLEVTAAVSGEHFFTVTGVGESVGFYSAFVEELRLIGNEFDNDLKGTDGDDTLFGNGGDDFIDGNGGIDVAVFEGNRDDFEIGAGFIFEEEFEFGPFDEDTDSVFVFDLNTETETEVINVETLRFDDGDVSILEFIDDFGDTRDDAGAFSDEKSFLGDFSAKGRIDTIDDVDAFTVDLEEGDTFAILLFSEDNISLGPNGPADEDSETTTPFTIQSILDPDDNAIERASASDDPMLASAFGSGVVFEFGRATQSGSYLFSFAGVDQNIGNYFAELAVLPSVGSDDDDFFLATPLDDLFEGNEGDDTVIVQFVGGTDFFDGGEGEDSLEMFVDFAQTQFAVSADGDVTITDPDGNVITTTNVEEFAFFSDLDEEEDEQVFTLEELQAFAEVVGEDEDFALQLGDDEANELDGGTGNDVYNGGAGDDVITDAGGNNSVNAGEGADKIGLVSGANTVDGGTEGDLIIGGIGNDNLAGGAGDDVIVGDVSTNLSGSDRITGGEGDDFLEGRGGLDTFVFATNDGTDTIGTLDIDFDDLVNTVSTGADFVSGLDVVELAGFGFADQAAAFANVTDVDGVATFSDQGTTIIFDGLTTADLSSDDFILV